MKKYGVILGDFNFMRNKKAYGSSNFKIDESLGKNFSLLDA